MSIRNVGAFFSRHKKAEEAFVEASALNVLWSVLRGVGLFGAGIAAAATVATVTSTPKTAAPTYHPTFSLSTKGAAFVTRYEGSVSHIYNDPYNCTIGVGHLIHLGKCKAVDAKNWPGLTEVQSVSLLLRDAGTAEQYVRSNVTHPINQPQFDALVDFTFNVGGGGLESSSALRAVNAGDFSAVTADLQKWSTASGHYLSGLFTRRTAEGRLFTKGDYGPGIGLYVPYTPKAVTAVPKHVPTWAWKWAAWKLGHKPYKGHAGVAKYRPKAAPHQVPAWAWTFLRRFKKG